MKSNRLHIDGIVQERETLKEMDIFDNPVYQNSMPYGYSEF